MQTSRRSFMALSGLGLSALALDRIQENLMSLVDHKTLSVEVLVSFLHSICEFKRSDGVVIRKHAQSFIDRTKIGAKGRPLLLSEEVGTDYFLSFVLETNAAELIEGSMVPLKIGSPFVQSEQLA
jgi:hypothetical protein